MKTNDWAGKTFPPVDTLCLYRPGGKDKPIRVYIMAYGKHGRSRHDACLMAKDQFGHGKMIGRIVKPEHFSPILSPEEEREMAIVAMMNALGSEGVEVPFNAMANLYDAGYRKP